MFHHVLSRRHPPRPPAHLPDLDDPVNATWQALARDRQVVEAIKHVRAQFSASLPEAVDLVNAYREREGLAPRRPAWWQFWR